MQNNSFPCSICGIIWSEESGAYEGFICEDCLNNLVGKELRTYYADGSLKEIVKVKYIEEAGRPFRQGTYRVYLADNKQIIGRAKNIKRWLL